MRCSKVLLLGVISLLLSMSAGAKTMPDDNKILMNTWEPHYFGRFSLRLPERSKVVADYEQIGEKIKLVSKNTSIDLKKLVAQKTEELKKGNARGTASRYEKKVDLDNGSVVLVSRLGEFHTLNAYLVSDENTIYYVMVKTISVEDLPGAIEIMRKLNNAIHFRTPQTSPPHGGFALEAGYTTLPNDKYLEKIYLGAQFYYQPDTYITLLTETIGRAERSLLQRFDDRDYDSSVNDLANTGKIITLRKGSRTLAGIRGEEVAVRTTSGRKTYYAFQFEYAGTPDSNTRPYIAIELGTHEEGSEFKSDKEALAWWDKLLQGFKPLE